MTQGDTHEHENVFSEQKVLPNIKQMRNEFKKISILVTVTKYNIDDIENLVHLANSLDVDINFQSLISTSLAHAKLLPKPEQIVSIVNLLDILRKKGFRVEYDHPFRVHYPFLQVVLTLTLILLLM